MHVTIGIDWATTKHDLCVLGEGGRLLGEACFDNTPKGLEKLIAWILAKAKGPPAECPVAIETPHGPLVELLLERGFPVYLLNPKQLDRFRDRFTVSGAKDDRRDALVLADSLRTDRRAFRLLAIEDPQIIELRELSRMGHALTEQKVAVENQLRQCLGRFYPQILNLCGLLDRTWVLELLAKAPTPELARKLRPATIKRIVSATKARKLTPTQIAKILRAPGYEVSAGTTQGLEHRVRVLVDQLKLLVGQLRENDQHLKRLLQELDAPETGEEPESERSGKQRDVSILLSLPGVGRIVVATLLAEAAELIRSRDIRALRLLTGVAPVTRRSGKRRPTVSQRHACNVRLRKALYHWARMAARIDPIWKTRYQAMRAKGHRHGRACRGIGDRLLRIACAMLRDGTTYEPGRIAQAT